MRAISGYFTLLDWVRCLWPKKRVFGLGAPTGMGEGEDLPLSALAFCFSAFPLFPFSIRDPLPLVVCPSHVCVINFHFGFLLSDVSISCKGESVSEVDINISFVHIQKASLNHQTFSPLIWFGGRGDLASNCYAEQGTCKVLHSFIRCTLRILASAKEVACAVSMRC